MPPIASLCERRCSSLGNSSSRHFPATPILPALGNNDEECGDYELQPGGPFLADTLPILRRLVGSAGGPGFDRDWQGYGNYSARAGGIRVLSTNTNFLSVHYRNACGSAADGDPGRATLAWLEAELAAAKEAQERVWLLYHIPPGIDGYATLRQGACPGTMIPMWDQAYAGAFLALLKRYADTVTASFAGHTHMDDFRLIGDAEGRYGFALITPAVSPIFGQNPAFRTFVYDAAGGILDQTTYDLTNLPQATDRRRGRSAGMAGGIHLYSAMEPAAGRSAEPRPPLFADHGRSGGARAMAHDFPGIEPGLLGSILRRK